MRRRLRFRLRNLGPIFVLRFPFLWIESDRKCGPESGVSRRSAAAEVSPPLIFYSEETFKFLGCFLPAYFREERMHTGESNHSPSPGLLRVRMVSHLGR